MRARAPGRVNLIGDHVDYVGGPVLPMAIQLETVVTARVGGDRLRMSSQDLDGTVEVPLPVGDPAAVQPAWGRYVAGVAAELGVSVGLEGRVASTVPPGGGLSSSAALEVATALALGATGPVEELARACRRAEELASGVPCGIMDQLVVLAGRRGHALLIDCATEAHSHVRVPDTVVVHVVDPGRPRRLAESDYATRRREAETAARLVGHLPDAEPSAVDAIPDPVLRRRARHVRSESERVRRAAEALAAGDVEAVGALMVESHRSLREDAEVSTPELDRAVEDLCSLPGVLGARLTGAGFGGNVVALALAGTELPGRRVVPSDGASVEVSDDGCDHPAEDRGGGESPLR